MFKLDAKAAMNRNLDLLIRSVIVPPIARATSQSCEIVLAEAKALVPVDTGALRASGSFRVIEERITVAGIITFAAPYAGFVEYGTGIRGRGTYPGPLPKSGVPITGEWIYDYRSQGWIGRAAHPYLRPALDASRGQIVTIFRDTIMRRF